MKNWIMQTMARYAATQARRKRVEVKGRHHFRPHVDSLEDRTAPAVFTFQQGIDGPQGTAPYFGTQDTTLEDDGISSANQNFGTSDIVRVGNSNQAFIQGLTRFDDIIGSGPGQIPAGSTINKAELLVWVSQPGDDFNVFRINQDWDESTATYNNFGSRPNDGIFTDGTEAAKFPTAASIEAVGMPLRVELTPDVQAWADGEANFGWGLLGAGFPVGTEPVSILSSESLFAAQRPALEVDFTPPESKGDFEFSRVEYTVTEDSTSVTITVARTEGADGTVTVDFATADGTAVAGQDYVANSGTLTFEDGVIEQTFTIDITADNDTIEGARTIDLSLSNPTDGSTIGAQGNAIVSILDNDLLLNELNVNPTSDIDGAFEYVEIAGVPSAALSDVYFISIDGNGTNQGVASLVVPLGGVSIGSNGLVVIKSPDAGFDTPAETTVVGDARFNDADTLLNGTASFVLVSSPTAISDGTDLDTDNDGILDLPAGASLLDSVSWTDEDSGDLVYGGVLLFQPGSNPPGAATRILDNNVPFADSSWVYGDLLETGPDSVEYTFATASSNLIEGTALTPGGANVIVPGLRFAAASFEAGEEDGVLTVQVERIGDLDTAVSVEVSTADGTAVAGDDYVATTTTLDFAAGQRFASFEVELIDDGFPEISETGNPLAETFNLTLANPSGTAAVRFSGSATGTIIDDDILSASFQEGVNNYVGTQDVDMPVNGGTPRGDNTTINVDSSGLIQALTRFDNIFGNGAGQVPVGSTILSATLVFSIFNTGNTVQMHRILGDWSEDTATWNNFQLNGNAEGGIQGDGVEATDVLRTFSGATGIREVDVTEDVALWASGDLPNFGWGFTPTGSNGVDWFSSENDFVDGRPQLMISYSPAEDAGPGGIRFRPGTTVVDEGAGQASIIVERTSGTEGEVSATFTTADGTAVAGEDYTATTGTVTFVDGQTTAKIFVPILEDAELELSGSKIVNETFSITLSDPQGGAVLDAPASTIVEIADNEVGSVIFQEGFNGYFGTADADPAQGAPDTPRNSPFMNPDGSNIAGLPQHGLTRFDDIIGDAMGQVPLNATVLNATLSFAIFGGGTPLNLHTLTVPFDETSVTWNSLGGGLQVGVNASPVLQTFSGQATAPGFRDIDVTASVQEWVNGATNFGWGFTPTGNDGVDWLSSEIAQFDPSLASLAPRLQIDFLPSGADLPGFLQFQTTGTEVNENDGTVDINVVRLFGRSGEVTVDYATSDVTAVAGKDYVAQSGTLTFADGVVEQTITVELTDDMLAEGLTPESFAITLSNPTNGSSLGDPATFAVTVTDDDNPGSLEFALADFLVNEGDGMATVTVRRVDASAGEVLVDYATSDGSARAGSDYTATSGTLTFADGQTEASFTVDLIDDMDLENIPPEFFNVTLSNPRGGLDANVPPTLAAQASATVSISDNEVGELLFRNGVNGYEGTRDADPRQASPDEVRNRTELNIDNDDGTVPGTEGEPGDVHGLLQFRDFVGDGMNQVPAGSTVLEASVIFEVIGPGNDVEFRLLTRGFNENTASWNSIGGGIQEGVNAGPALFTFDGGTGTRVFEVTDAVQAVVNDPDNLEQNFGFGFTPTGGNGVDIASSEFNNVDFRPALRVRFLPPGVTATGNVQFATDAITVNEADGTATVTVSRTAGDQGQVTIDYATADGTAVAGEDYVAQTGTLTFGPGVTSQDIVIDLLDDDVFEGATPETFSITLSNPGGGVNLSLPDTVTVAIEDFTRISFQNGVDGYEATQDAFLDESEPGNNFNGDEIEVDLGTGSNVHAVTRFDDIIGAAVGQIPEGALIVSANLELFITNTTDDVVNVHTLTTDFDETAVTWDSIGGGLQVGVNANEPFSSFLGDAGGFLSVDVTASVQEWVDGTNTNLGWGFTPTGTNGVDWASSEVSEIVGRPRLVVEFVAVSENGAFEFESDASSVNEGDGTVNIPVVRTGGTTGVVSVDYTVTGGTAIPGEDFDGDLSGTLNFADGEMMQAVSLNILDDMDVEGLEGETFTITLSNAQGGATLGLVTTITVTIVDNDFETVIFQNGRNGYEGTQDTDMPEGGDTPRPDGSSINIDASGLIHAVTRFDDLFGTNLGQIPEGSTIISASLVLNIFDGGNDVQLHRILGDWSEDTATWNNFQLNGNTEGGIQGDGLEATPVLQVFSGSSDTRVIDVTEDVTAWAAGTPNFGWGFTPTGNNGVDWDSSESSNTAGRPQLVVDFIPPAASGPGVLQFETDTATVEEDAGSVTVPVVRTGGFDGEVSVDYTVTAGTATEGQDYGGILSGTLDFADGAMMQAITVDIFEDMELEGLEDETFTITLSDPQGGAELGGLVTITVQIVDNDFFRISFQEGVNGYENAQDAFLDESDPGNNFNEDEIEVDLGTGSDVHAVTRFDDIIGAAVGQIPEGATILSASLELFITNTTDDVVNVHTLTTDFDETTVTWDSIGGGLQVGVNANEPFTSFLADAGGFLSVDVTASVQEWVDGTNTNLGWGFTPTGTNGVDWASSEVGEAAGRPRLFVAYLLPSETTVQVEQLTPTPSGFVVDFNQAIDTSDLNLYEDGNLGNPDLILTGPDGEEVPGTLIPSADGIRFTFIATGGPLAAGDYELILVSGDNAFVSVDGELLDGNGDGTAGDDYVQSFSVSEPAGVVVSLPDFARGPDQGVVVPNTAAGLPVTLSDATDVTSVTFEIAYDPSLLEITGAEVAEGLPDGATVNVDTSTSGIAVITLTSPSALSGTDLSIINLTARVPGDATRGFSQVLSITGVSINNGAIDGFGDDAVHSAAFFGDVNNNGAITVDDVTEALQVAAGQDTGFAGLSLVDPRLTGDVDGDGSLTVGDVLLLLQAAAGQNVPQIPLIP